MTQRRGRQGYTHSIGDLFTFALFGLFVLLSLLIVVIGADVYRSVVQSGDVTGEIRTSLGYVAGKLRSEAASDGVAIEAADGVSALVLTDLYEDTPYRTAIYYRDGGLYETFYNADEASLDMTFGDRLVDINGFSFDWAQEDLLRLTATAADGSRQTLHIAMRAQQEAEGNP